MPLRQRLALAAQPVGAGAGQPAYRLHLRGGQAHAIRHEAAAFLVVGALAAVPVKQAAGDIGGIDAAGRSEEHTSELQSLMRNSYAVFCLKKKKQNKTSTTTISLTTKRIINTTTSTITTLE